MRLFIQAYGVTCPLGRGKTAVSEVLFAGRGDCLTQVRTLSTPSSPLNPSWPGPTGPLPAAPNSDVPPSTSPHRPLTVGAVTGSLPPVPDTTSDLDCRNNRLMLTALEEIRDAVTAATARHGATRIAVICGTSTSGISDGESALAVRRQTGHWEKTFHYRRQETGNLALFTARALNLLGPAYTIATACSSSGKVFASARRLLRTGLADAVVVGGADTLCNMTLSGFGALEALSPTRCNPFSVNRDGITIGEGAAAFLLTREPGPIELLGIGETSDAHHPSAPDPEGRGATTAIQLALQEANLTPTDIAYINLHGTATPLNDAMESRVIANLFGQETPCSSTKGMTGHMLGASGGVEAAFLCLSLADGRLPPHIWDGQQDPALPKLNFVTKGQTITGHAMLSNSFGFGGSNVALVLGLPR
jgi:3-oxoacyl-[acyl-carrier-protein] synthase-1